MIVPIGRGNSEPLVEVNKNDKKGKDKRKLNRRVVVRLLEPIKIKKVKFGLGVYFKDAVEDPTNDPLDNVKRDELEVE